MKTVIRKKWWSLTLGPEPTPKKETPTMKNQPAFPMAPTMAGGEYCSGYDGMTLRQYGAFKFGAALVIAHPELRTAEGGVALIAKMALSLTDATLAEMEKQP